MKCASCNEPLRKVAGASAIELWLCDGCKGALADVRSLRTSVPRPRMVAIEAAIRGGPFGRRKCPHCELPMTRARVTAGDDAVEVDGCDPCAVVWFDHGELRRLQDAGQLDEPRLSSMTPEQRHAWRIERLREEGRNGEDELTAHAIGVLFGIPYPEPVRDYTGRPWITWGLCALVTLPSLAAFAGDFPGIVQRFGLVPANLRWFTVFTHFFLHADVFHLAGNVLFLAMFGSRVEAIVGRGRLLSLVALATAAGGLVHAALTRQPWIPLIGASGGISGVLAAHAALRPRARVRMRVGYGIVTVRASGAFLFWIALQAFGTLMQISGASAVSALGHLGGAAAGFALGLLWKSHARAVEPACA
jgi:membrane associated rhomboid family serine protease